MKASSLNIERFILFCSPCSGWYNRPCQGQPKAAIIVMRMRTKKYHFLDFILGNATMYRSGNFTGQEISGYVRGSSSELILRVQRDSFLEVIKYTNHIVFIVMIAFLEIGHIRLE
jgi:hypothetical protein